METQHPTVVRRSFIALVLFTLISAVLLAGLVASAMKKKKEHEQVAPVTPKKVMPSLMPAHQDQVESNKGDGSVVVRTSFSFEVAKGTNRGPAVVPQPK